MTRVRRRGRPTAALLAAVALLAVAGCSSGGAKPAGPDLHRLREQADLQPCPATSAGSVAGGLPDLTLPCIGQGPAVRLAGLRGMPTVVNFYGTWCIPCQREAGYLSSVAAASKATVRFLGVDVGGDHMWDALSFAAALRPPAHYALVSDPSSQGLLQFNPGPPATVFVNAAGKVVGVAHNEYHSAGALRADIRRYLRVAA